LDTVDEFLQKVRNNQEPFGGVRLVLAGDFAQLPYIPKDGENVENMYDNAKWKACFGNKEFSLTQIYRQEDKAYIDLLSKVRRGNLDDEDIAKLESLKREAPEGAVHLYARKKCVEAYNKKKLEELKSQGEKDVHTYTAVDDGNTEALHAMPVAQKLELVVGAWVMLLQNINAKEGLVNGACGEVMRFERHGQESYPVVRFT
jgi:ATP-dependent DNA helicase PIF1